VNRLAIFDCDGTLVDSGGNIHAALADSFTEFGIAVPTLEATRKIIGLSLVEAIAALVPDADRITHVKLAEC
jgi:phosphoglycolate phosphatase